MRDDRQTPLTTERPPITLIGLMAIAWAGALAADDLAVALTPGFGQIQGRIQQIQGRDKVACNDGETLTDGYSVKSTIVVYYNEAVNGQFILVVDGTEATTGSEVAPTDAEIEAALPNASYRYTVAAVVTFARSGSAITLEGIDHTVRSFGVEVATKDVAALYDELDVVSDDAQLYRPWGRLAMSVDAADIANGDVLTDLPLPLIYGRIPRYRIICEKAITTAARTATISLEIGAAAVTGSAAAYAGTKALGTVTAGGTITAANTFKPGDLLSIIAAAVTAFAEGRVRIEVEIDELVIAAA